MRLCLWVYFFLNALNILEGAHLLNECDRSVRDISNQNFKMAKAKVRDLGEIKKISNQFRKELPFIVRQALEDSIRSRELFVAFTATTPRRVIGFIRWYKRKTDGWVTIHELGVHRDFQRQGIGLALLELAPRNRQLKVPIDNRNANRFYRSAGLIRYGTERSRKGRLMAIWKDPQKR